MSIMEQVKKLRIPFHDVSSATNNFGEANIIGRGGFGNVYLGLLPQLEPSTVAVKRLDRTRGQGQHEFMMEISISSYCKHENLVSLVGLCDENGEKILVYEYASNGSLEKFLASKDLTWVKRLEICLDAARGLMYLHHEVGSGTQHRIIHRDIKSAKILLDENWKAKVSDFGLSRISPANSQFSFAISNPCGTSGYVDPQYLYTGVLTKESDVFSFGVVLFEVLCSKLATFEHNGECQMLCQWARKHYENQTLDEIIDPDLRAQMSVASLATFSTIAYNCIKLHREERPTMIRVVEALEEAVSQEALSQEHEDEEVLKEEDLVELPRFLVSRDNGCLIGDLGGLINLKGKLAISGLEEVENVEEAKNAKLDKKARIEALEFEWNGNRVDTYRNSKIDEDVLEGLKPHSALKSLKIVNFKGVKLSSWMISESVSVLENLVEIKLDGCDKCEQVPTLGRLANLKKVELKGLKRVKKIGQEFYHYDESRDVTNHELFFPALRELVLDEMDMLEEWVDAKQVYPSGSSSLLSSSSSLMNQAFQFPNLELLRIWRCANLVGVPSQFPSLKKLFLLNVCNQRLDLQRMSRELTCLVSLWLGNVQCEVDDVLDELCKNNSSSLKYVSLRRCHQLKELPKGLFKDCSAMESLNVEDCSKLEVHPDIGPEPQTSLRRLAITGYHRVRRLPDLERLTGLVRLELHGHLDEVAGIPKLPSSIETLNLKNWRTVQQLPQERLEKLSALKSLTLSCMDNLEALPEWLLNLSSLEYLEIFMCGKIKSMPTTAEATLISPLKTLSLSCMYNLEALPEWLPNLSSLENLKIYECRQIKSMPTAEATRCLKRLKISSCPVLEERCIKDSGKDWPSIRHIPYIKIGSMVVQNTKSK